MRRFKVVTVVTATVTEEFVLDVPDDIDPGADDFYWGDVLVDFAEFGIELVSTETLDVQNENGNEVIRYEEVQVEHQQVLTV